MTTNRRTRRSNRDSIAPSYHIYCINFYDNGLAAVQNEFIHRVKLGMRLSMFVIDMEEEVQSAILNNEKMTPLSRKPVELKSTDPVTITLQRVQECIVEYVAVSERIESEKNFNLYQYWLKNVPAELKNRLSEMAKKKPSVGGTQTKRGKGSITAVRVPKTAKGLGTKANAERISTEKIECMGMTAKEHHKVGKGQPLSRKLYIKDNPPSPNLIIMIVGKFENEFYTELLRRNQPLSGIIHFLPEESAYDLLVSRPRREKALKETIEKIQRDINSLRKRTATKPVGIFQQQLPQMSMCLTTKFSDDIFNQLSWFVYDVELLRQQYIEYYLTPFNEINVKMGSSERLQDTLNMVESLSLQGHYLKAQMPAASPDDASIYLYMESLMSTFGNPRELLSDVEVALLANPSPIIQVKILDKIKVYSNAFKSVIKLEKNERLFVENSNNLLTNLISYVDQNLMRNIYHACLEYNLLRRYFNTSYILDSLPYHPYNGEMDPISLPKYAELYLTDDSVNQRIIQLVNEYDNYTIKEIYPSVRLYTFRRVLNEVFENQKQYCIPTKLCFRDFTLFEMEQFLKDLVTSQMFENSIVEKTEIHDHKNGATITGNLVNERMIYRIKDGQEITIDPNIFIRPQSLKAKKMVHVQKENEEPYVKAHKARFQETKNGDVEIQSKDKPTVENGSYISIGEEESSEHNYIGLGPNHPMLTGYNLDDTRQTIKGKTSKYFFEEGRLTLYEEKWNFRQMNKCLSFEVNKQTVHFNSLLVKVGSSSNSVRVETQNGVNLRILPSAKECSTAVLNYPNGLSLHCHETHAEHLWSIQENEMDESRRICTPYGCVIVFYNNTDLILIMRYNGEVYYLYNVENNEEGEEEEENNTEFKNACSTYSTYSSYKPVSTESKKNKTPGKRHRTKRNSGGTEGQSHQSFSSKTNAGARRRERQSKNLQAQALLSSIDNELKFLNLIMSLFSLSYRYLKLITSVGSLVHLRKDGKIWCGKPFQNAEWHDYCTNECYSMRDDGVKLIWTANNLKCYHTDGTVIITELEEGWEKGVMDDEIDHEISSSSSHSMMLPSVNSAISQTIYINDKGSKTLLDGAVSRKSSENMIEKDEAEEEYIYHDPGFITYIHNNYQMKHHIYAGIDFKFTHITDIDLKIETTVFAADNLSFRIYKGYEIPNNNEMPGEEEEPEKLSSEADADEWSKLKKIETPEKTPKEGSYRKSLSDLTMIQINGNNINLLINKNYAEINTKLRKFGCDGNTILVRDSIHLKLNFIQTLSTVFRNWVEELNRFIHCHCPKVQTLYFLETTSIDCRKTGFELMKKIPPMGEYNFCAGNYFIDVKKMESVKSSMVNYFDWYENDMKKFPRFHRFAKSPNIVNFPMVLSTKVYVEIPAQLANVDRIHKFVEPFDKITFRKLKYRFNEAVLFHIYPRLRLLIQQEISKRSWRSHHQENSRRRFLEQQRLSLYMAMLKYKVYPNYFQFKVQYDYHVRNIEFFEYMTSKCSEKLNPEQYQQPNNEEEGEAISEKSNQLKGKAGKKCYCPKYIKSLKK